MIARDPRDHDEPAPAALAERVTGVRAGGSSETVAARRVFGHHLRRLARPWKPPPRIPRAAGGHEGEPWLVPDIGAPACRRARRGPSVGCMGRILLIVAAVVIGFLLLGSVLGLLFTVLKWALIIGLVGVVVMFVSRLFRSSDTRD